MSPECVDLLNKIFQINEAKRIKIEEIRQHPWYVVPLAPRYERAMAEILAEQAEIAAHLRMASVRPPPPWSMHECPGSLRTLSNSPTDSMSCVQNTGKPAIQS